MAYYFVLSAYLFICFILIFSYEVIFNLVLYTICLYTFMFFISLSKKKKMKCVLSAPSE